jgi:hypothetical protein
MNAFVNHHRDAIRFDYSCFDRMILGGCILALQLPGQVASFLRDRRKIGNLSRSYLAGLGQNYRVHVEKLAADLSLDILEPGRGDRREDLVKSSFQNLRQPGIAAIVKAREPERIAINQYGQHLEMTRRWVMCYTFYLYDAHCGPMSLRICSYFPFNIAIWMNQHNWLARQLQQQGIAFRQCDNCFLDCADPQRLQQLADSFGAEHIKATVDAWVARLLPFFSAAERGDGYRHHLLMRQIEYCHNIIFHKKAALNKLFDRLLDHGRALGHPNKLAIIFGRSNFHVDARTGEIQEKVTQLRTPVLRADLGKNSIKQYVREGGPLRTEATTFQLKELSVPKGLQHLPRVRKVLGQCTERFESVQQDILETFVDRGQLQELRQATVSPSGRRTPGLRPHDPRLLAVLQAVLCFMHLAGKGCFKTAALLTDVQNALGNPAYKLSQLRYDLGKLRGKGLVLRLHGTQSYQLTAVGFKLGILYLKLHQRFYAPLTAGICDPQAADNLMLQSRTAKLDRLYLAIDRALEKLSDHVGLVA